MRNSIPLLLSLFLISFFSNSHAGKLTADFNYVISGKTVTFTDISSGPPTSWLWEFGDGNTSTIQNPENYYETGGDYSVTLTISNGRKNSSVTKTITIDPNIGAPIAGFRFQSAAPSFGEIVQFTDESIDAGNGPAVAWIWDFGNGVTSTEQNPSTGFVMVSPTVVDYIDYNVCQTVFNISFQSSQKCEVVRVFPSGTCNP